MKLAIALLVLLVVPQPSFASDQTAVKERVTGIGGLFFRAENPSALGIWYEQHLGVSLAPTGYEQQPWHQEPGPTVLLHSLKKQSTLEIIKKPGWLTSGL